MLRNLLIVVVIVLTSVVCSVQAAQVNSTWVGGYGDWGSATMWNPVIVPNNNGSQTFAVTIDGSSETADVQIGGSFTINSLATYGDVDLQNWGEPILGLTVLNGLNNYGELELQVSIFGDVINNSNAYMHFYTHINIYGDLINSANATMEFQNIDMDVEGNGDGGRIINNGLIQCSENGGPGEESLF